MTKNGIQDPINHVSSKHPPPTPKKEKGLITFPSPCTVEKIICCRFHLIKKHIDGIKWS